MSRWSLKLLAAVTVVGGVASADSPTAHSSIGERHLVETPLSSFNTPVPAKISPYIYLNRCLGGCSITGGSNTDARSNQSAIPAPGSYTVTEFSNVFGQTDATATKGTCLNPDGSSSTTTCTDDAGCASLGAGAICDTADYEWGLVVQCMKEVYSPFNVNVVADTTVAMRPAGGVSYTMAVIAGQPGDIGEPDQYLGVAPISADCSPQDNVISFTFANHHPAQQRIYQICATAAQETAHAFGLDHEFSFPGGVGGGPILPVGSEGKAGDGASACNDPMTYSNLCGGEKFFRNETADCGEYSSRPCRCGGTQNSHAKILDVFGAGTSLIPPPSNMITLPADGATVVDNWNTSVVAGSKRGVAAVELWLNGYKWNSKPGAPFDQAGQADPAQYSLVAPNGIPDGGIKIVAKAFDDLGSETDATVSVTKGALCTDASSCLAGQKCNTGAPTDTVAAGGCYWDPPSGNVGDACTYNQFCLSGVCQGPQGEQICTNTCIMNVQDSCPSGFECDMASDGKSYCFKAAGGGGGCCSASTGGAVLPQAGLGLLVLTIVMRRRRRCAA